MRALNLLATAALATAQTTVPRCKLGASDVDVSCVIMGSLHLHEAGSPQGVLDKVNAALALGMDTWDTSDVYNSMPELLGQGLALQPGLREKIKVIAKMDIVGNWPTPFGFDTSSGWVTFRSLALRAAGRNCD